MFKCFAAYRISEIQQNTNPMQWGHVTGEKNPADLVSRGASINKLVEESIWWGGPEFLSNKQSDWPVTLLKSAQVNKSKMKKVKTRYTAKHEFHNP